MSIESDIKEVAKVNSEAIVLHSKLEGKLETDEKELATALADLEVKGIKEDELDQLILNEETELEEEVVECKTKLNIK